LGWLLRENDSPLAYLNGDMAIMIAKIVFSNYKTNEWLSALANNAFVKDYVREGAFIDVSLMVPKR